MSVTRWPWAIDAKFLSKTGLYCFPSVLPSLIAPYSKNAVTAFEGVLRNVPFGPNGKLGTVGKLECADSWWAICRIHGKTPRREGWTKVKTSQRGASFAVKEPYIIQTIWGPQVALSLCRLQITWSWKPWNSAASASLVFASDTWIHLGSIRSCFELKALRKCNFDVPSLFGETHDRGGSA